MEPWIVLAVIIGIGRVIRVAQRQANDAQRSKHLKRLRGWATAIGGTLDEGSESIIVERGGQRLEFQPKTHSSMFVAAAPSLPTFHIGFRTLWSSSSITTGDEEFDQNLVVDGPHPDQVSRLLSSATRQVLLHIGRIHPDLDTPPISFRSTNRDVVMMVNLPITHHQLSSLINDFFELMHALHGARWQPFDEVVQRYDLSVTQDSRQKTAVGTIEGMPLRIQAKLRKPTAQLVIAMDLPKGLHIGPHRAGRSQKVGHPILDLALTVELDTPLPDDLMEWLNPRLDCRDHTETWVALICEFAGQVTEHGISVSLSDLTDLPTAIELAIELATTKRSASP